MNKGRLLDLVGELAGHKVLVLGDIVLDKYLVGRATRLSREAPVPILEFDREFSVAGAAANPANNIKALGGEALIVGVIGDDEPGQTLKGKLQSAGIDVSGIIVDPFRPTTTKTRVLAEDGTRVRQQIVRIDRLDRREMNQSIMEQILTAIETNIDSVDAVLFSDYQTGLINKELISACLTMAQKSGSRILTADSQGDIHKFAGFTLVKSNQTEAESQVRQALTSDEGFAAAAVSLRQRLDARSVVITRGWDGMTVSDDQGCTHIPVANKSEVFDVTGAGDTVIAVLTLALAAGAKLLEASHLSNIAAGLVVKRLGNATVTPAELRDAIQTY